jgi:hypothetical protein
MSTNLLSSETDGDDDDDELSGPGPISRGSSQVMPKCITSVTENLMSSISEIWDMSKSILTRVTPDSSNGPYKLLYSRGKQYKSKHFLNSLMAILLLSSKLNICLLKRTNTKIVSLIIIRMFFISNYYPSILGDA